MHSHAASPCFEVTGSNILRASPPQVLVSVIDAVNALTCLAPSVGSEVAPIVKFPPIVPRLAVVHTSLDRIGPLSPPRGINNIKRLQSLAST